MLSLAATPLKAALSTVGLKINRVRHAPYEELWQVPRFTEHAVRLLDRPFRIADSRSFFFSYQEIFVEEIYRFETTSATPRIIDCGSNYGTSIVYFNNRYPGARITGIEADPAIYALLRSNTSHLMDIDLLQAAVSHDSTPLRFYREGSDGGRAGQVIENAKQILEVPAVTLDKLIGDDRIDFLKIDIEGAEGAAIEACSKLDQVEQMFIEYHSFRSSAQRLGALLDRLAAHGFRYYIHEQFCSPRPLIEEALQLGMDLQLNIFAKRAGS